MDNISEDSEIADNNVSTEERLQPGQSITKTISKTTLYPPSFTVVTASSSHRQHTNRPSHSKIPNSSREEEASNEIRITSFGSNEQQLRAKAKAAALPPPDGENISVDMSKVLSFATLRTQGSVSTTLTDVASFMRLQVKTEDVEGQKTQSNLRKTEVKIVKLKKQAATERKTTVEEKLYAPTTHVIFDLDGTLLDTESINNRIIAGIATEYDSEFSPDIQCRVMGRIASDASITAVELMQLPLTAEQFAARVEAENKKLMEQVDLMPGAECLIRHLSNNKIPIAVATSAGKENYEIKSKRHKELFSLFHHIVTGGSDPEVVVGKPAPDIYLVAASRFPDKPKPSQCLAIEDSANGVKAAINAGMQVVMIPDPCTKPEYCKEATLVLKSMLDFQPELFGLPRFVEK